MRFFYNLEKSLIHFNARAPRAEETAKLTCTGSLPMQLAYFCAGAHLCGRFRAQLPLCAAFLLSRRRVPNPTSSARCRKCLLVSREHNGQRQGRAIRYPDPRRPARRKGARRSDVVDSETAVRIAFAWRGRAKRAGLRTAIDEGLKPCPTSEKQRRSARR